MLSSHTCYPCVDGKYYTIVFRKVKSVPIRQEESANICKPCKRCYIRDVSGAGRAGSDSFTTLSEKELQMHYASVCSGVEAPTLAWHGLGWKPVFFSEIEEFPSAVLRYHYPEVPNLGDMTKIKISKEEITNGTDSIRFHAGDIDLFTGGTPCQSYSLAGRRKGLDDPRGRLMLDFVRLAYEMRSRWIVWENVPGVLSQDNGKAFACLLSNLAGWNVAVPDGGWRNAGIVTNATSGNYGLAYRVLDAQYVRTPDFPTAIPQRRRRVFVVGYLGDWKRPAEVFADTESLRRTPPPCRKNEKRSSFEVKGSLKKSNTSSIKTNTWSIGNGQVLEAMSSKYECLHTLNCMHDVQSVMIKTCNIPKTELWNGSDVFNTFTTRSILQNMPERGQFSCVIDHMTGNKDNDSTYTILRKLYPVECERLMGFPDNYTRIPWKGKPMDKCPDGHRYKACGNSMCVNCMEYIGRKIQEIEDKHNQQ